MNSIGFNEEMLGFFISVASFQSSDDGVCRRFAGDVGGAVAVAADVVAAAVGEVFHGVVGCVLGDTRHDAVPTGKLVAVNFAVRRAEVSCKGNRRCDFDFLNVRHNADAQNLFAVFYEAFGDVVFPFFVVFRRQIRRDFVAEKRNGVEKRARTFRRAIRDYRVQAVDDVIIAVKAFVEALSRVAVLGNEDGVVINLSSDDTSFIIGRRGENLDALQYLASMFCNRLDDEYYRVVLDSNGYREKRKKTLEDLAKKIAKNVLRSGRSTVLEPMNPYERRIIHSMISEIEGVSSRSVGEEPYRKIIISSLNKKDNRHGGRGGRKGDRRKNDGRKNRNFEPRSLDLKTSFEKDYKKPKPEDDLKAGLYGKIEL